MTACPNLIDIELVQSKTLDLPSLYRMVRLVPRLECLQVNCCNGQELSWLAPLKGLDHLIKLEFVNEPRPDASNTASSDKKSCPDHLGEFLIARASTLRHLSLEAMIVAGFKLFESSASTDKNGPRLPALAIETLILSNTLVDNTATTIDSLLRQCPRLIELDISRNFARPWQSLQWSILSDYCQRLTHLDLSSCSTIDNNQLVKVVWACPGMSSLVACQSNIESKVLHAIVDRWIGRDSKSKVVEPFTILDVSCCSGVNQASIERGLKHIDTLTVVKISWCLNIGMTVFYPEWGCPNLQHLEVQGLSFQDLDEDETEVGEYSVEWAMFRRLGTLKALQRLTIGSMESYLGMENGFGHMRDLKQLEDIMVIGTDVLEVRELEVIAALPRLQSFAFRMGFVTKRMQQWLRSKRPDIEQIEQPFHY
ncbi:hypothetical protein BGZ58_009600 [Dissophora ornata]|nr:hypothetical protein BGZ58_009600 [Dissophora ornata]